MLDKKMLILLLLLIVQVFFVRSGEEQTLGQQQQLNFLSAKISKELALAEAAPHLPQTVDELTVRATANREKLYPANLQSGAGLGKLQQLVQGLALAASLEFVRATWGEPVPATEADYLLLPLSCTVRGYPSQIDQFLASLATAEKFVKIETAQMVPFQNQKLTLTLALVAYQSMVNSLPVTESAAPSSGV